ncbi:MAG: hypothetical protein KC492_34740 [Myxococcales bacterium]|nr:hypothetical protein [Myxococcales bacterium]
MLFLGIQRLLRESARHLESAAALLGQGNYASSRVLVRASNEHVANAALILGGPEDPRDQSISAVIGRFGAFIRKYELWWEKRTLNARGVRANLRREQLSSLLGVSGLSDRAPPVLGVSEKYFNRIEESLAAQIAPLREWCHCVGKPPDWKVGRKSQDPNDFRWPQRLQDQYNLLGWKHAYEFQYDVTSSSAHGDALALVDEYQRSGQSEALKPTWPFLWAEMSAELLHEGTLALLSTLKGHALFFGLDELCRIFVQLYEPLAPLP